MKRSIFLFLTVCVLAIQLAQGQVSAVTLSGVVKSRQTKIPLAYVNLVLKLGRDSSFVAGTITDNEGRFSIANVKPAPYFLEATLVGYGLVRQSLFVGSLSAYLDLAVIELDETASTLDAVVVAARREDVGTRMDKKSYTVENNLSQRGGSVLQAMQNLPGVTVQEGRVQLRGSDRVAVLIDGKQTALTGFGNQAGLDNLPASSIDRIEIINHPTARYDANGSAGIINIILKKSRQDGLSGKAGLALGLGSLWVREENLPGVRPQYQYTPKINPSLALNYRKKNINAFLQADNLYTETLNKNEFVTRTYDTGVVINQQLKRNRNTNFFTTKAGIDWSIDSRNSLTISGLFGSEKIIDRGDQIFYNEDITERYRLWQFLEDELKTTVMATAAYQRRFTQPGHLLNAGFNYTFHREDEKYFFDNIMPAFKGEDAFALLSDEHVADINVDYIKPLKHGRFETGIKFRWREIPTNMQFFPGINSPIDSNAGGPATYKEVIPAIYGNYVYESPVFEAEAGIRIEYVHIDYVVGEKHPVYSSDGYSYTQPFPNIRLAYKFNERNKLSVFFNRRVDRPNEVDIRIFPKYDDAEIIKVGNPALRPQFTNAFEIGFRTGWKDGYLYTAAYHRITDSTITRIASAVPGSFLIYAIFQNAGRSYNTGLEGVFSQRINPWLTVVFNANVFHNQINAFTVENLYPIPNTFVVEQQELVSGNIKFNGNVRFKGGLEGQVTAIYLAPDIIPQGRINGRFSLDLGLKKNIQKGKGEWYVNATDLFNTLVIDKEIQGENFSYTSTDYYETQVIRVGYNYKF